uniref:Serine-threonine/tyrosine-protein kinase catalytic domain-containing protein n=1 Tax=Oryza punctata TaxID=4537 RepID=A0A0E0MI14_ORYPU
MAVVAHPDAVARGRGEGGDSVSPPSLPPRSGRRGGRRAVHGGAPSLLDPAGLRPPAAIAVEAGHRAAAGGSSGRRAPEVAGKLPNGVEVAVQRRDISSHQGEDEFMAEIDVIPKLRRKNIIELIEFCAPGEECILVYEYISNGSLASIIRGKFSILTKTKASISFLGHCLTSSL